MGLLTSWHHSCPLDFPPPCRLFATGVSLCSMLWQRCVSLAVSGLFSFSTSHKTSICHRGQCCYVATFLGFCQRSHYRRWGQKILWVQISMPCISFNSWTSWLILFFYRPTFWTWGKCKLWTEIPRWYQHFLILRLLDTTAGCPHFLGTVRSMGKHWRLNLVSC